MALSSAVDIIGSIFNKLYGSKKKEEPKVPVVETPRVDINTETEEVESNSNNQSAKSLGGAARFQTSIKKLGEATTQEKRIETEISHMGARRILRLKVGEYKKDLIGSKITEEEYSQKIERLKTKTIPTAIARSGEFEQGLNNPIVKKIRANGALSPKEKQDKILDFENFHAKYVVGDIQHDEFMSEISKIMGYSQDNLEVDVDHREARVDPQATVNVALDDMQQVIKNAEIKKDTHTSQQTKKSKDTSRIPKTDIVKTQVDKVISEAEKLLDEFNKSYDRIASNENASLGSRVTAKTAMETVEVLAQELNTEIDAGNIPSVEHDSYKSFAETMNKVNARLKECIFWDKTGVSENQKVMLIKSELPEKVILAFAKKYKGESDGEFQELLNKAFIQFNRKKARILLKKVVAEKNRGQTKKKAIVEDLSNQEPTRLQIYRELKGDKDDLSKTQPINLEALQVEADAKGPLHFIENREGQVIEAPAPKERNIKPTKKQEKEVNDLLRLVTANRSKRR